MSANFWRGFRDGFAWPVMVFCFGWRLWWTGRASFLRDNGVLFVTGPLRRSLGEMPLPVFRYYVRHTAVGGDRGSAS